MMEYCTHNLDITLGLDHKKSGSIWTVQLNIIPKNNGGLVYSGSAQAEDLREAIRLAARRAFSIPGHIGIDEEHFYKKVRCLFYRHTITECVGEYPWAFAIAFSSLCHSLHKQFRTNARTTKPIIMA